MSTKTARWTSSSSGIVKHRYRRNEGGRFGPEQRLYGASTASLNASRLLDLTGDSGAELVREIGGVWSAYRLQNNRWIAMGDWSGTEGMNLEELRIADLNGDYRMDAMINYGEGLRVWLGTEDGFGAPVDVGPICDTDPWVTPVDPHTRLRDVNGDGLSDAVYVGSESLMIYLGRGDGTFTKLGETLFPWSGYTPLENILLGDLNRDGLMDFVRVGSGVVQFYAGLTKWWRINQLC